MGTELKQGLKLGWVRVLLAPQPSSGSSCCSQAKVWSPLPCVWAPWCEAVSVCSTQRDLPFPFVNYIWCGLKQYKGFPSGFLKCRTCRRLGFDPWVRKILWRRAWQPTPVFLPGESHWQRSLEGYSPWGQKSQTWLKQLSTHSVCPRAYCASGKATPVKTNSLRSRRSRSTQGVCVPFPVSTSDLLNWRKKLTLKGQLSLYACIFTFGEEIY